MLLADDSLIVRDGLRALLGLTDDIDVVGVVGDYEELIACAEKLAPDVIVSDIRMPPMFQREGIDAALLVRKRHPGTGIVLRAAASLKSRAGPTNRLGGGTIGEVSTPR